MIEVFQSNKASDTIYSIIRWWKRFYKMFELSLAKLYCIAYVIINDASLNIFGELQVSSTTMIVW